MRDLVQHEMKAVAGGYFQINQPGSVGDNGPKLPKPTPPPETPKVTKKKPNKIATICNLHGLSDSAVVKTTAGHKGNLNLLGNGTQSQNQLEITTTCGSERKHGGG